MSTKSSAIRPPLVLVHGFRGAPIGLKDIADSLRAAGYPAYTPALPPCFASAELHKEKSVSETRARSKHPSVNSCTKPQPYTPDFYATFLKNYIEAQHLEHPILIGHSMGSVICTATAQKYPDLLHQKLILLSPIAGHTPKAFTTISPLSALCPRYLVDYLTTRYLFVAHDHKLLQKVLTLTHDCSALQSPSRRDNLRAARFASKYCIDDFLPIKKDVLLLAGNNDRLVSKRKTLALADKIAQTPTASVTTTFLSSTGHLHNYEQPHETAEAILNFLDRH